MSTTQPVATPGRLSREERLGLVVVGIGAAAILVVAACLDPSPLGFGTHRQLGLPPCTFVALWNMPCPSCGMTTAFAHFVRGHWLAALRSNVGGAILAALATLAALWAFPTAALGRWIVPLPRERTLIFSAFALVGVVLVDWALRLALR